MIKKKMTQGFMDDYNFSILSVYALSALFGSAIQSILFRSFHRELAHIKILIIAFQLCFVRIAIIIIETGIEKGGHKKIMKLNFPCKVFFQFTSSCCVLKFSVRSILFTLFYLKYSLFYSNRQRRYEFLLLVVVFYKYLIRHFTEDDRHQQEWIFFCLKNDSHAKE